MKGIVFCGCSFTWGQGLYFYSNLPRLIEPKPFSYDPDLVTKSHLLYKNTINYPRLVANHFDTIEFIKNGNGGSEDESFDFLNLLFHKKDNPNYMSHITTDRIEFGDVDYVILQLSQLWRNKFYFEHEGEQMNAMLWPNTNSIGVNQDKLLDWMLQKNYNFDEWVVLHKDAQIKRLIREFEYYESKGIKCRLLTWENDLLNSIKNTPYLSERFIQLNYKNKTYDCIRELQIENRHLEICGDEENFEMTPPIDHHPSKECHEIIAKNIIERLENEKL